MGSLNTGAVGLRIGFNLSLSEDLSWSATLDSPDQGSMGIPLGEVKLTGDSIRIEAPGLLGYYLGKITSPTTMDGIWHQAGRSFQLDLEKKDEAIVLNRPQEPMPPFPYKEEEVNFPNKKQGFSLAGTLTIPDGEGPFPAAILVTGSGSQNRDEEIFGHKPFKVIADYLTRNGIAVLRYDDRGAGGSGGSAAGATTEDLATDAWAALDYLLSRPDIDPVRTGIIGHSEGGLIAFILASSQENIKFLVSLAGPGVNGKTILLDQSDHIARLSGAAESILEDNRNVMNGIYEIMIDNESYETWKEKTLDFAAEYYSNNVLGTYSEEDIERGKQNLLASIPEPSYAWIRYFVMFDPASLFVSINCPVLALNGEKDCQVLPEQNISAINTGLEQAGNTCTKAMILPGLNHLFQNCDTGLLNEYGIIEETFDPGTLELISNWIWQQVK
jgi:pimeloyl-ACP methyl ester carboxylesterase